MHTLGRPRQYVSAARLYAMFPVLRFSYERGAYVLRFVGENHGPVLRKDRRRRQGSSPVPTAARAAWTSWPHGRRAASGGSRPRIAAAPTAPTALRARRRPRVAARRPPTLPVVVGSTADSDRRARITDPAARLAGAQEALAQLLLELGRGIKALDVGQLAELREAEELEE